MAEKLFAFFPQSREDRHADLARARVIPQDEVSFSEVRQFRAGRAEGLWSGSEIVYRLHLTEAAFSKLLYKLLRDRKEAPAASAGSALSRSRSSVTVNSLRNCADPALTYCCQGESYCSPERS
jgi:hypothetical protein